MREPEEPLCSVIVPAYNAAAWVEQAIDSALAQTYPAVEVVVVDDGSTDDTAQILQRYGDRIRVVSHENRGLASARNSGIEAARGEYVAFLDADDWWAPGRLERCLERLHALPHVDSVTTDAVLVDGDVLSERRFYGDYNPREFPEPDRQPASIVEANFMFVSAIVPRAWVTRVGAFDPAFRAAEDYDLWMRMLAGGARFGLVDEPLAYYRIRPDSLSRDAEHQWTQHLAVLEKNLPAFWPATRAPAGLYFQVADRAIAGRRYRTAARFLAMGARAPGLPVATRARAVARGLAHLVGPKR